MTRSLKECDDDKIVNPKTGYCVSRTGNIGKRLLKDMGKCPDEKNSIFNPTSKRCVKRSGVTGKGIIKSMLKKTYKLKQNVTFEKKPLKIKQSPLVTKNSRKSRSKVPPIKKYSPTLKQIIAKSAMRLPVMSPKRSPIRKQAKTPVRSRVRSPKRSPIRKQAKTPLRSPVRKQAKPLPKNLPRSSSRSSPVRSLVMSPVISPVRSPARSSSRSSPVRSRSSIASESTVMISVSPINGSMSVRKNPIVFPNVKQVYEITDYRGTKFNDIASILFLDKLHGNTCTTIPKNLSRNLSAIKNMSRMDIGLVVIVGDKEDIALRFDIITDIIKCKKRFFIIPLTIQKVKGAKSESHANFLIYDSKEKSMERFEPLGERHEMKERHDNAIFKLFKTYLNQDGVPRLLNYYPPILFCPKIGPQQIDRLEKDNMKSGDPVGFCAAWCIWYVNLRLSNPDIDRKDVLEEGIKIIDTKFNSFRNFIRSYAQFLSEYSKKLKETEDISYTFREMRGMFDLF